MKNRYKLENNKLNFWLFYYFYGKKTQKIQEFEKLATLFYHMNEVTADFEPQNFSLSNC